MALPSRNATNMPRWFRAAAAFLHKRQGTALPSRNASNLPRWFRAAAAFLRKRRKKRRFLRETRRIYRDDSGRQESFSASAEGISLHPGNAAFCRDDSGRQLPFSTNAERNDASFAKRVKSAAMVQGGSCLSPQTPRNSASFEKRDEYAAMVQGGSCLSPQAQKETTLPSRNATNMPRWFRAATAFLRKRQGTALPSGNAAILFRTIIPARSSLPQVPKACASAALCGGAALPGRRRDEKFHILLLRERPA